MLHAHIWVLTGKGCDGPHGYTLTSSARTSKFCRDRRRLPDLPAGADYLVYVGQTGRSLRERLSSLRRHELSPEMPFNDPHTAAPLLWALRHAEYVNFECSATPVDMPNEEA